MAEPERAPLRATPPRSRRGLSDAPAVARPGSRKRLVLSLVGAVVLVAGFVTYYWMVLSDQARHHEFEIAWPVSSPRGEPIEIGHELKAGDIFRTRFESHFLAVLSVENNINLKVGMNLDAVLVLHHGIAATPSGLESTYRVGVEEARSTPSYWTAPVWVNLNNSAVPCVFRLARDATGKPIGRPSDGGPYGKEQRRVLDSVLSGLGDVSTNYLPPRPIRLGDVWNLDEAVALPGILTVVRFVAESDKAPTGYPEPHITGKVEAQALETRDSEPCLRLRLVVYVTHEGAVVEPANPGRLSTAAKIDGHIWISVEKGVPWEQDLSSEITTSYLAKNRPTERHATATIRAKTSRTDVMPGGG